MIELQFCLTNLCLEQCNKHAVFVFITHKLISQNIKTTCLKLIMHVWLVALKCWLFGSCEEWGGTSIQQALGITDAQIDLGHGELEAGSASHLRVLYCVLSLLSLFCDVYVGRKCQNNNHMNPGPRFPCRTLQCNKMISLIYLTLLISTLKVMLVGSYRCTFPEGTEQLNLLFCVSGECKSNFHCF